MKILTAITAICNYVTHLKENMYIMTREMDNAKKNKRELTGIKI